MDWQDEKVSKSNFKWEIVKIVGKYHGGKFHLVGSHGFG
ncbi:uncharacterized protein G2W53_039251 [Senna tora]|uniref:Uncharacterized protein n=1 Tax=Senna tora TaxID=362788 RepID=A0A834SQE1_9FABA|nr:uncharacterized protein G2W53_039251 [Senna tora]